MSARPELPREFVAVHKRRRIMEAMAESCYLRGYESTKIADVVARAAVARKTLYDNFGGKEELFLATFEEVAAEVREKVEAACAGADDSERRIEAGLAALLSFVSSQPAKARLGLVEAISATPASAVRYGEEMDRFVSLLREAAPPAPELPATLPEALTGGVAWVLQQRLRRGEADGIEELLPDLTLFVRSPYHGVGNPDE